MTYYEDCIAGPYHPFRDHKTEFGWGICHAPTGRIFGYIGAKGKCFGVCAALNGKWEAAKMFMDDGGAIPDGYFLRFKEL